MNKIIAYRCQDTLTSKFNIKNINNKVTGEM